jgi:hypothetical protein
LDVEVEYMYNDVANRWTSESMTRRPINVHHMATPNWPIMAKGIKFIGLNGIRTHDLWRNISMT